MHRTVSWIVMALAAVLVASSLPALAQSAGATQTAGGSGGAAFSDLDVPQGARVLEVHVYSGRYVDAVQMQYVLPDGRVVTGPRHGGPGGTLSAFRLDSDEAIVALSGRFGQYIDSIRIHTSKRTSPLLGGSGGRQDYRIEVPADNQAVGFTGRAGNYLDAIGLTYVPRMTTVAGFTKTAGGTGGQQFADRQVPLGARISQVRIRTGRYVDSIQAVYTLPGGSLYEGPLYGGTGGTLNVLELAANEYITGISGRAGNYVDSIVVHTNRRSFPAYGGSGGRQAFRLEVPAGNQALGFTGRAARYLDAIGLGYAPRAASPGRRNTRFRIR
ncbi:MAG: hypothetical protein JXP48_00950 [Acidobacteria bacterium]|nr:hypothetical protein [Acidobacteriota bacterium]